MKSKNNNDAQQTIQKFEDVDRNPIALLEDYTK